MDLVTSVVLKARKKFWASKDLLLSDAPLKRRISLLYSTVWGCMAWVVGAFLPSQQSLEFLNSFLFLLISQMAHIKRRPGEATELPGTFSNNLVTSVGVLPTQTGLEVRGAQKSRSYPAVPWSSLYSHTLPHSILVVLPTGSINRPTSQTTAFSPDHTRRKDVVFGFQRTRLEALRCRQSWMESTRTVVCGPPRSTVGVPQTSSNGKLASLASTVRMMVFGRTVPAIKRSLLTAWLTLCGRCSTDWLKHAG